MLAQHYTRELISPFVRLGRAIGCFRRLFWPYSSMIRITPGFMRARWKPVCLLPHVGWPNHSIALDGVQCSYGSTLISLDGLRKSHTF